MATSISKQDLPVSETCLKTMFEAEDRCAATRLSLCDRFKDCFKGLLGMETKREKVNAFYNAILKETGGLQNKEGRMYLDP